MATELSVEEKLKALYHLQLTLSSIDEKRALRGELPLEVQDLEDELEGLHTRVEKIESDTKELQAAEKKRIGKLSRLYNEMKPDEAAKILTALDDEMLISILQKMDESQVSQILANEAFGADRAADITRKMYAGTPKRVANPNDEE